MTLPILLHVSKLTRTAAHHWLALRSLWLALDEAMAAGVRFPDVVFLYNTGDQPMCNKFYRCESSLPC